MTSYLVEAISLDEVEQCSLDELARYSGMSVSELSELIELGVLPAPRQLQPQPLFQASCIVAARTARRLRDDFELDMAGVGLALQLLTRIHELERQLADLAARGR
jgi:chaperone modulatory protein CbpM